MHNFIVHLYPIDYSFLLIEICEMPNIKFSYLYRDAGNYKNYGHVIFANPNNLSLEQVMDLIKPKLIDGTWFYAKELGLPDLHFDRWDEELDHGFHEFEGVEFTDEEVDVFLMLFRNS